MIYSLWNINNLTFEHFFFNNLKGVILNELFWTLEILNVRHVAQGLESRGCSENADVMTGTRIHFHIGVLTFYVTHFVNSIVCNTHTFSLFTILVLPFLNPMVKYLTRQPCPIFYLVVENTLGTQSILIDWYFIDW